jgi:vacuolar protein sorting-associated protein 13A/C
VFIGLADGITGLVMQPIRETEKEGLIGFVKGTAKGITGLVIKPITGILDASAKTAESISNTATHFDDKCCEIRMRLPRVFYEKSRYFLKYNAHDAECMLYL